MRDLDVRKRKGASFEEAIINQDRLLLVCEMVIRLVGNLSSWAGFNKPETNAR